MKGQTPRLQNQLSYIIHTICFTNYIFYLSAFLNIVGLTVDPIGVFIFTY